MNLKWKSKDTTIFTKFSLKALELNEKKLALQLAERAIGISHPSGWSVHYDGGTKLQAFKALKRIDSAYSSKRAFDLFSFELIKSDYPGSLLMSFNEIIPSIIEINKPHLIWDEVLRYIKRLLINSIPIEDIPKFENDAEDVTKGCLDLMLLLARSPVKDLNIQIQKVFVTISEKSNERYIEELKKLAYGNEKEQELFINIILTIDMLNGEFKKIVLDCLKNLSNSENYYLRESALQLVLCIDPDFSIEVNNKRKLHPIYNMYLNDRKILYKKKFEPFEFVRDTDDPEEFVAPHDVEIELMSKITGINKANLLFRMVEIMKTIDDPHKLTSEYEQNIRSNLAEIDLHYAYPRPRAEIARRALMHITSELVDLDLLNIVYTDIQYYDLKIDLFKESKKPDFIETIKNGSGREYFSGDSKWLNEVSIYSRFSKKLLRYRKEWNVIGEFSTVKSLNWGTPTEIYSTQIINDGESRDETYNIFGSVFNRLVDDYCTSKGIPKSPHILIINEHRYIRFNLKSNWVAFNPILARKLNWMYCEKEPFKWLNSKGDVMVQSVYWRNGNINMTPPQSKSEVGEGWFVIASDEALQEINNICNNLKFEMNISRSYRKDMKDITKEFKKICDLNL